MHNFEVIVKISNPIVLRVIRYHCNNCNTMYTVAAIDNEILALRRMSCSINLRLVKPLFRAIYCK